MKILYITEQVLNNNSGVTHKVASQAEHWRKKGHSVEVVSLKDKSSGSGSSRWHVFLSLWRNSFHLYQEVKQRDFDVIYTRYFPWTIWFNAMSIMAPLVLEINSDEGKELKARSRISFFYNLLTKPLFMFSVKGVVFISKELKDIQNPIIHKAIVIANGIDETLFEYPVNEKFENKKVHLVFTGSFEQEWQGLDKIIPLVRKHTDLHLHVVGLQSENEANITYHGRLSREENLKIISRCHVGISTLALHRKGMEEASSLKSREYLALGLPVIMGYRDTDLEKDYPFLMKLANTEDNVISHEKEIVEFCRRSLQFASGEIRKTVRPLISMQLKEEKKLAFIESLKRT